MACGPFFPLYLYLLCLIDQRCCYLLYSAVSLTRLNLANPKPSTIIKSAKNKDSLKNKKVRFFSFDMMFFSFDLHKDPETSGSLWRSDFLHTHGRQKVTFLLMTADAFLQIMRHLSNCLSLVYHIYFCSVIFLPACVSLLYREKKTTL